MKSLPLFLIIIFTFVITAYSQTSKNPAPLQFKGFKIGDTVDTTLYKKYGELYFPNYLNGWTMNNVDRLPDQYKGLPIAIWQLKKDSSIALTLLKNTILKITISYIPDQEKNEIEKMITEKLGFEGVERSYQETHPLQSYITFWDLKTWETKDVIVQIGYGDLRSPNDPKPIRPKFNLVYTNLFLENKIINDFRSRN